MKFLRLVGISIWVSCLQKVEMAADICIVCRDTLYLIMILGFLISVPGAIGVLFYMVADWGNHESSV